MLLNKNVNAVLQEEGVVVIPFLHPAELAEVESFYNEIKRYYKLQFTHGMHMTLWHSDVDFKSKIQNGLLRLLHAAYLRNFSNCRRLNNIFMVKQAQTMGDFAIHNDWSIVDETKFESINVWIPLQDVAPENGGVWMLKGSHKIDMPIRGGGALLPDFSYVDDVLKEYRTPIAVKAGEAMLFYHKTIHGSYPNTSHQDRVVCTFSIIPENATLQICFQKDPQSPLEIHTPSDDFNYKYNDLLNDTNTFAPTKEPKEIRHDFKQKNITLSEMLPFILKN
jgi:ectoine hydroxylase-related dioxygenase (phytanoyl-CoA dioxygenase family)